MQKKSFTVPGLLGKAAVLVACSAWLAFITYYWNSTSSTYLFPRLPLLEAFMGSLSGSVGSMKLYFGSLPLPALAFFLILLSRTCREFFPRLSGRRGVRAGFIALSCVLLALTAFCNVCLSNLMTRSFRFWKYFGLTGLGDIKVATGVFGAASVYVGLAALLLSVLLAAVTATAGLLLKKRGVSSAALGRRLGILGCCFVIVFFKAAGSVLILNILRLFDAGAANFVLGFMGRNANSPSLFIVCLCFAPIMEEIAFRGVMTCMADKALPRFLAVVFSSVCFGLWHRNLGQFAYTFLWGMVYGYVFLATGRIFETMLMHAGGNLLSILAGSDSANAVLGKQPFWVGLLRGLTCLSVSVSVLLLLLFASVTVLLLVQIRRLGGKSTRIPSSAGPARK